MASEIMQDLWERFPEVIRDRDTEGHLFRWLEGARVQMDDLDSLLDFLQLNEETTTSTLIDPASMEDAWIPWNRMIRGIPQTGLPAEVARQNLASPAFFRGTANSMTEVVKYYLTGSKSVAIYPRSNSTDPLGTAGEWDVCIVVRDDEYAASITPVEAVIAAKCKPAGVDLFYRAVDGTTWQDIETNYPTWADWHAAATWSNITSE